MAEDPQSSTPLKNTTSKGVQTEDRSPLSSKAEDPQSSTQLKNMTSKGVQTEGRPPPPEAESKPWGCCHGQNGRNLVVAIDGTANQFGDKNTNVIELYHLILKGVMDRQRTWYNSGIGTYARPSWKSLKYYRKVVYHKIDLAIAWDFERTVMAAYRWLSDNYEPGDCIFLFGFSRGAYQVRVLSAMINKVGLIYKGNEMQIPFAYELYADPKSDEPVATQVGVPLESPDKERLSSADRFKKAFSYEDVKVHFVGAWDTVSSIGIVRGTHLLPGTVDGMNHVCYFRHALALDERRVKFLPEYAYGGSTTTTKPPAALDNANQSILSRLLAGMKKAISKKSANVAETSDVAVTPDVADGDKKHQHTLEVWFAGTHSNIGGGNTKNISMDRSRPPLRWMVFEAGALGLRTAPFQRELSFKEQIEIKESLTYAWWPLELLPLRRLTHTRRPNGSVHSYMPHLGSSRKIHPGQKIHSSLLLTDKTSKEYTPKARPVGDDPLFWEKDRKGFENWLELDLYEYAKTLVEDLIIKPDGSAMRTLRQTATSADGRQAVYEGFIVVLSDNKPNPEAKQQLVTTGVDILTNGAPQNTSVKLPLSKHVRELFPELRKGDHWEISRQFIERFTEFELLVLKGLTHEHPVFSVAFSPDGKRVVSGSDDKTVRIWDAETGKQVGDPLRGHTDTVWSVAFAPDGRRVVSGSTDQTIRIWDTETGKQVGEPFRGHTHSVKSVAFSPDGKRIVSGSADDRFRIYDETVRIWDAETGKQVGEPLRGHTEWVRSVAFSPDGRRVVSGSDDDTVRIWDAETGKQVGEPFRGHTHSVWSVAFSPDGKRLVSGSWDDTVQIWDAETGKQVGEPFRGHTNCVNSVAFSPDGRRVVSGSADDTVRIWDAETGKQVGEPFRGHTHSVMSVAFSPDGKRIVSGSYDNTIRIWDAETFLALAAPSQPSQVVVS